jgi:hypothetical protein
MRCRNEFGPSPYRYLSDVPGVGVITVPHGFVSDWASIPQELWAILPPWGRYGPASVPHDWGYWEQTLTRLQCDNVLKEASLALGVEEKVVETIYNAVRLFGDASWQRNKALKDSGYKRMVLSPDNPPFAGLPE